MAEAEKLALIALLDFPRKRILQSMELNQCPHAGFFNKEDKGCQTCHQEMECTWMNSNDEAIAVEAKSVAELKQQLLVAVDFIDASLSPYHLARRHCECENCTWLKKANQLLDIQ